MSGTDTQTRLWLPHHWPAWLCLAGFWLASKLTRSEQRRIARLLGWIFFHLVPIRRRVVTINLGLCFPEKSPAEIHALARDHYYALAFAMFEICTSVWTKSVELPPHRIIGLAHLKEALASKPGVILLSAHFTTIAISMRLLVEAHPAGMLYRNANNPVFGHFMEVKRAQYLKPAVHFEDLRGLIRALRHGNAVWYAPDQSKLTTFSEIIPFLGVPAITNIATSKIATMSGAAVVPFFAKREADNSYTLTLLPALENFPTANPSADAVRINQLIGEYIKKSPEQYFWVHKRFKRRGPDYPEPY